MHPPTTEEVQPFLQHRLKTVFLVWPFFLTPPPPPALVCSDKSPEREFLTDTNSGVLEFIYLLERKRGFERDLNSFFPLGAQTPLVVLRDTERPPRRHVLVHHFCPAGRSTYEDEDEGQR